MKSETGDDQAALALYLESLPPDRHAGDAWRRARWAEVGTGRRIESVES